MAFGSKRNMENWKSLIDSQMVAHKETWDDVVSCTLSQKKLLRKFDAGYGGSEGEPFTLWTKNRVYFPVVYDGAEWVGSAPRNPCKEATKHQGGQ